MMTILQQAYNLAKNNKKFNYKEFKKLWLADAERAKRKYRKPVYTA